MEVTNKGIRKAVATPQIDLRQPRNDDKSEKILPFVTTFNQNNPSVSSTIKTTLQALCDNEVAGIMNFKLIQRRRQPANSKKILTKAKFTSEPPIVKQCGDKRCECCKHLLLLDHYVFRDVNYEFTLKSPMSCDSAKVIYVIICSICNGEYIGKTGVNKQKLRDKKRKCLHDDFKIFPFLQMHSTDKELRRMYELRFQLKFNTKLNQI